MFRVLKLGADYDARWADAPTIATRGKWDGYQVELDLRNWSERSTYFLGRFYDLETQLVLRACAGTGDRVVDVGANIGMITLLAASIVGPTGVVDAFEPNPRCQARLRQALRTNGITHVRLHPTALGATPDRLILRVISNHSGMGTLGRVADEERDRVTEEVEVPVSVGDDLVLADPRSVDLVKVDTEGFETHVLRGLRQTLERFHPVVTTEFLPWSLERAGSSQGELAGYMRGLGYSAYAMTMRRKRFRFALRLIPFAGDAPRSHDDVAWVHPKSRRGEALRKFM